MRVKTSRQAPHCPLGVVSGEENTQGTHPFSDWSLGSLKQWEGSLKGIVSKEQECPPLGSTQVQTSYRKLSHIQAAPLPTATSSNWEGERQLTVTCLIKLLHLLIKRNVNGWILNSLKIVFILPKYSTMGSGTFQREMTYLIHSDSKTPFNSLGRSHRVESEIRPNSEKVMKTIMS